MKSPLQCTFLRVENIVEPIQSTNLLRIYKYTNVPHGEYQPVIGQCYSSAESRRVMYILIYLPGATFRAYRSVRSAAGQARDVEKSIIIYYIKLYFSID